MLMKDWLLTDKTLLYCCFGALGVMLHHFGVGVVVVVLCRGAGLEL